MRAVQMAESRGTQVEVIGVNWDEEGELAREITDSVPSIFSVTKEGFLGQRMPVRYNAEALYSLFAAPLSSSGGSLA